ncbi:MAG: hypothetical protein E2O50_04450 [Gammaproteobacteria bacterium]|nr:MAG: hypothetical protein E2O50_04450 [Gammaproteobacteria bacterium]
MNSPSKIRMIVGAMLAAVLLLPVLAHADAIMRSQAMFAETIAEIYVNEDELVLELEIGMDDVPAFRNLLPDEIYKELGYGDQAIAERLQLFFERDIIFKANGETLIPGRLSEIGPGERQPRDPITGELLPVGEGEAVTVIRARFVYEFNNRPDTILFGIGPTMSGTSIGYVLYHKGIAVNDFRYLTPVQNLQLDWNDPWYTKFSNRSLRRAYFAPMSGFIYVEPYEVRKEIILRPKDLQHWLDLGLEGKTVIPAADQVELKRKVGEFLRTHHKVLIDGEVIEPELARINFLERTLKTSKVIDPPVDLDINAAILGVIFVYPTVEPLPQKVTMEWDLFNDKIQLVPASSVDQAGPLPTFLEPDFATLEWQNFLQNPELPTLTELRAPPSETQVMASYLRWVMLALTAWLFWRWLVQGKSGASRMQPGVTAMSALVLMAINFWLGSAVRLSNEASAELVGGVLHNVYRAFDFRDESQIYDVLDQTVAGELLTEIFLETRRGLELANQGGARVKVKDIEIINLEAVSGNDGAIEANVTWRVAGSVGHWGHLHKRQNQYEAKLTISPVAGVWKLTGMEVFSEERI